MKRLPSLAVPRLHPHFPPSSYLLHSSRFPTSRFPVLAILLMLVMSPLLSIVVLQPAQVAAQHAPGELDRKAIYDSSAGPVFSLPQWTDGSEWDAAEYYSTIQMADINNDNADELLARGYNGMTVHEWDATLGLWKELSTSGPFSNPEGWNHPEYYSTIQTADIDGDGSAELLGRGVSGMNTYKWDGTNWQILSADDPAWTDAGGWSAAKFYSTIQTADIDGEKGDELLARGINGMDTYKWSGSEWTLLKSANPFWSDSNGWGEAAYYSTIQTANIDGEKGDELLALNVAGMDTYKWNGSAWKLLKSASPGWEKGSGWDRPDGYTTIQTGDIDGDGQAELFARGMGSLSVFTWTGGRWKPLFDFIKNQYFPDYQGWNHPGYYLTLQSADIDGEKGEELLIRHSTGMLTYKWNAATKLLDRLVTDSPKLADDHWADADNYLTIQTGDVDGDGKADLIARGIYGIRTWS